MSAKAAFRGKLTSDITALEREFIDLMKNSGGTQTYPTKVYEQKPYKAEEENYDVVDSGEGWGKVKGEKDISELTDEDWGQSGEYAPDNIFDEYMALLDDLPPSSPYSYPKSPSTEKVENQRSKRVYYEDEYQGPMAPKRESLPMDEESRLARMEEQGFTTDLYSGLPASGTEFIGFKDPRTKRREKGIFLTDDPRIAEVYAAGDSGTGGIVPAKVRMGKTLEIDLEGASYDDRVMDNLINDAIDAGYESLKISNMKDVGSKDPQTQYVVLNSNQVRSRFARFDPRNIHSTDLVAGVGGVGLLAKEFGMDQSKEDKS